MRTVLWHSLQAWWPETILSVGALAVLVLGASTGRRRATLVVTWGTLAGAALALYWTPVLPERGVFFGLIICDPLSLALRWLALATGTLVVLLLMGSREIREQLFGESLGLVLLILVGLMAMAEANHLLMAYLSMELVSLSSYVLVGFLDDQRGAEASLKYLLFGALSSGIMLFGMSLLFGLTGQLAFPELLRATQALGGPMRSALLVSVALMLAGLAFKVSMVPCHMWTPDDYEGAPLPVTALLSVGPKAAGLALLIRMVTALAPLWTSLAPLVLLLTVFTMTLGNLVALVQSNVKRLLAYSTIGQVGYLLIGVVTRTEMGLQGLLLYIVAYLCMNLGAFACVIAVVNTTGSESLEAFRGLSRRAPGLALMTTLFLLSLAGIPPLLGFFGKFLLFGSAIHAGELGLALAAIVNSAVALYYYVNLIRLMYLLPSAEPAPVMASLPLALAIVMCTVVTVIFGLFPGWLLDAVKAVASVNLL